MEFTGQREQPEQRPYSQERKGLPPLVWFLRVEESLSMCWESDSEGILRNDSRAGKAHREHSSQISHMTVL